MLLNPEAGPEEYLMIIAKDYPADKSFIRIKNIISIDEKGFQTEDLYEEWKDIKEIKKVTKKEKESPWKL